jgi:hypothetical protein
MFDPYLFSEATKEPGMVQNHGDAKRLPFRSPKRPASPAQSTKIGDIRR